MFDEHTFGHVMYPTVWDQKYSVDIVNVVNDNCSRIIPFSTSTMKRRHWDAGLLGRVAKKKPYLRLANKKKD
jgi:hypothetical protein